MTKILFIASFDGDDGFAIIERCVELGLAPSATAPFLADASDKKSAPTLREALELAASSAMVDFGTFPDQIHISKRTNPQFVMVGRRDVDVEMPSFVETLSTIPFELAILSNPYGSNWGKRGTPGYYEAPILQGGHHRMGWGVAFRGRGHERVVSRRWLEDELYTVSRGPNDTTLVQFHDLALDRDAARERIREGHARFAGGYIPLEFVPEMEAKALYHAGTRTMRVVIHGRDISDRELYEWAVRRNRTTDQERPFDAVRYIFMTEDEARTQLARIPRYGHEVWAIVDGDERRLDS